MIRTAWLFPLFPRPSFLELHAEWKSKRRSQNANIDERMTVLPGVFPVGCKLESESRATVDDGLQAVDEALSKQASMASRVPPSWAAARRVVRRPQRVGSSAASSGSIAVFHCLRAPGNVLTDAASCFAVVLYRTRYTGRDETLPGE